MSTHYINAQGVDRSKLDALSLHRFLAGYPLTTKTFTQIDSNLRVYWHTLFDLCPGLLKLDGPDGMNMFRGFIKTACAQNLPLNWTLHASFYRWLLSSEFASRVNEEHLEAIMMAAVSLWCSNDTSGKVGIALAHQHSSVVVVGWKARGHKTALVWRLEHAVVWGGAGCSLELVMIPVEHRRHGGDFLREQAQVHLGVAHLDHAAQQASVVELALRLVHGAAVAAHLAGVALRALVFGDELLAQRQVGALEYLGALGEDGA